MSVLSLLLLAQYSGDWLKESNDSCEKSLILFLKQPIWDLQKLWESSIMGIVVKCSNEIVAKVIYGNKDYTEYTSMEYLAKKASNIPAPRPHGRPSHLVLFALSHNEKLSIQRQLDSIFSQLRSIRQDDNNVLAGVCGEGVKVLRVDECALFTGITTTAQFNELQFSAVHHGSNSYVKFLRSFLDHDNSASIRGSVFTHGEESISPMKYPVRWLVDRLWGIHLRTT